jgi:SAM-dependent methyltransferase
MTSTIASPTTSPKEEFPAHRKFVGPPEKYDLASAGQFSLLTALGLREDHTLLDIGCGSLRGGRLFVPYLKPGNYFGIEPEQWLIDQGIDTELGRDLVRLKQPSFNNDTNFTLTSFGRKFDYMLAQSIFSHATQPQIRRCLSEAKKALEPTGIFAATFFPGETNYEGTEWVYPGCVYYTLEYFSKLVADEGLRCKPLNWTHTNQQKWVAITHPEYIDSVPDVVDSARIRVLEHEVGALKAKIADLQQLTGLKFLKKVNRLFKGKKK